MKRIHRERLQKLARFLKTIPEELFDMTHWMELDKNGHMHRKASIKCGTPACAMGWATSIFPELYYESEWAEIKIKGHTYSSSLSQRSLETAKVFFGVSNAGFRKLFSGIHENRTVKQEIEVIERYLNDNTRARQRLAQKLRREG